MTWEQQAQLNLWWTWRTTRKLQFQFQLLDLARQAAAELHALQAISSVSRSISWVREATVVSSCWTVCAMANTNVRNGAAAVPRR